MDVIDIAAIEKKSSEQAERLCNHRYDLEKAVASFSTSLERWLDAHWVPGVLTIKEHIMRADGFQYTVLALAFDRRAIDHHADDQCADEKRDRDH